MAFAKQIEDAFAYDPDTGILTWKADQGRVKAGTEAGTLTDRGTRSVRWNGTNIATHRIAWRLMTGNWPTSPIRHKNGDLLDNRWENLEVRKPLRNLDPITRKAVERKANQALAHGVTRMYRKDGSTYYYTAIMCEGKSVWLGDHTSKEAAEFIFFHAAPEGTAVCPYAE